MHFLRTTEKAVLAGVRMLKRVHSHMKARKPAFLEVGGLSQVSAAFSDYLLFFLLLCHHPYGMSLR